VGSVRGWAGQVREAVRRRAGLVDAGVAVVVSVVALIGLTRPTNSALLPAAVACALVTTSSVAWRNRAPLTAVVVAGATTVGYQWLTRGQDFPLGAALALLLVLYTAGVRGVSRRHVAELVGLVALTVGVVVAIVAASGSLRGSSVTTDVQPPLVALAAGYLVARQRSLTRQLAAAIAQLNAEEDLRVAAAAAKERNRVARELHDVVTHGVSAMVVQAGAARITAGTEPELARAALAEVITAGRSALDELGRVVGTLGPGGPDSRDPPVGLAGIRALVEGRRAGGLPVQLTITGDDPGRPDPVDVACYRLVQEALTNVVKHAPAAPTTVELVLHAGAVEVSVCNAAPPRRGEPTTPGPGHGLIGMTERVAARGGHLSYGPQPGGGFEVRARLPLDRNTADPGRRPSPLVDRIRAREPWPAVVLALAVLCGDAAFNTSRRGPLALNLGLSAGMGMVLVGRRQFPLLFLIAVNALAFPISNGLTSINNDSLSSTYVFAVPVWAVAAWSETGAAVAGLLVAIGFEVAEGVHWHLGAGPVVGNAVVCVALWAAVRVLRTQRQVSADLARTRDRVEAAQRTREQLALAAARARMVAGLDTLVAGQVAAMVADAESAGPMIEAGAALGPIGRIEEDGRQALARLREILGLLRAEHDPGRLSPLLGIEQLDQLVARHARPERPTSFRVSGSPAPLLGGIDLVVYRIIEGVLAGAGCDAVDLHFDDAGSLRLHFRLAEALPAWPDPATRAEVELAGGRTDSTAQEIIVQLPLVAPALA
jgi:signal transduction histidine kinase